MIEIHKLANIIHSYWEGNIMFVNRISEIVPRDYFLILLKALNFHEKYAFLYINKIKDKLIIMKMEVLFWKKINIKKIH